MSKTRLIDQLRKKRQLLLKAYVLHVGLFTSTCACAATDTMQVTIATSLWLTLITVVPVLVYTVIVHKAIRAVEPSAPSVGLKEIILTTVLLTPLESGLFLPARNLWVSRSILRAWDKAHAFRLIRRINLLRVRAADIGPTSGSSGRSRAARGPAAEPRRWAAEKQGELARTSLG